MLVPPSRVPLSLHSWSDERRGSNPTDGVRDKGIPGGGWDSRLRLRVFTSHRTRTPGTQGRSGGKDKETDSEEMATGTLTLEGGRRIVAKSVGLKVFERNARVIFILVLMPRIQFSGRTAVSTTWNQTATRLWLSSSCRSLADQTNSISCFSP